MMRDDPLPPAGALLGIDYGKARIGLAKCDPTRLVVTPLATIEKGKPRAHDTTRSGRAGRPAAECASQRAVVAGAIAGYAREAACVGAVFGWPDEDDPRTLPVRDDIILLAECLRNEFSVLCAFVPESFSSREALDLLHEAKKKKKALRALDPYAAAVILRRYLDSNWAASSK